MVTRGVNKALKMSPHHEDTGSSKKASAQPEQAQRAVGSAGVAGAAHSPPHCQMLEPLSSCSRPTTPASSSRSDLWNLHSPQPPDLTSSFCSLLFFSSLSCPGLAGV